MVRILLLVLSLVGLAQAQSTQVFYSGDLSFHYQQFPFGSFSGDFEVAGAIDTTDWIPTLDEGLGGIIASTDSTGAEQLLALGAKRMIDTDTTYHVFGVYYRATGPIVEGEVPDATTAVQFFLLWNLDSLALPTEIPDSLDLMDILGALSAEHKFLGVASGGMTITNRDETTLDFTFSGLAVDLDNGTFLITVSDGAVHMEGFEVTAVEPGPPLRPIGTIAVAPNPFNPGARLRFRLDRPGDLVLLVHDMAGRRVARQSLGGMSSGEQEILWQADGLPSGPYLLSLWNGDALVGRSLATHLK